MNRLLSYLFFGALGLYLGQYLVCDVDAVDAVIRGWWR